LTNSFKLSKLILIQITQLKQPDQNEDNLKENGEVKGKENN
jgi:hypothetical protein